MNDSMSGPQSVCFEPIGVVHSPFKQKFGIPRQPGLVTEARGFIELFSPYNQVDAFRGLNEFSHLWLIYLFHAIPDSHGWKATVRPPRLGGKTRLGVFSSRSPFRPNPIGLSTVKLEKIEQNKTGTSLHISGLDLLDGTPIVDIKPYIPYTDSYPDAIASFAQTPPDIVFKVVFKEQAEQQCQCAENQYPGLKTLIESVLSQDPRPAYKQRGDDERVYGMQLYDLNIRWSVDGDCAVVEELVDLAG